MTEIDYLKCKLEDTEKAFDKLHKRHIELLKQQGKLEKENEQLKEHCKQLEQQYHNLVDAIVKTCNDLGKEDIYLGDFDVCKRITEYEKELSGDSDG